MWEQIALIVVSMVLQSIFAPKTQSQDLPDVEAPTAEEGTSIKKVYGTVWIEDPQLLAFKKVGRDKIRSKSGKK